MGPSYGDSIDFDAQDSSMPNDFDAQDSATPNQERIFVAVRLRPLNDRELSRNDVSDWESINNTTILFKNALHERSMLHTAYAFDRVFGCDAPTRRVYDEAAKRIALSVLNGMNSTIFAYGQTSSGKTYTMSGITECAIEDIYDYINTHSEREFVLRFSAMEIYNEAVRDLLVLDGPPLRLLDDPERGTVVDKLTEVPVSDSNHLRELVAICEAQRQIGETSLNEVSSRSHQILRLTVESEARGYHTADTSSLLTASVSFVDLAGSERASQTSTAGMRLKEGSHINRSLLTLGTVIRKLSKGRNAHIPYRDSKLTRILQNSLGGNARTAIICTMSPAHSHLEQSRNTLLFANCAKQVSTNAQVNVVMSEKALVKNLQKELARLEGELRKVRFLASTSDSLSALREKEIVIKKMDIEIRELTHQRNLAQSRVEEMLQAESVVDYQASTPWVEMHRSEKGSSPSEYSLSESSDTYRSDVASRASQLSERYEGVISGRIEDQFQRNNDEQFFSADTSPMLYMDKYFGPEMFQGWEKITQENKNKNENESDNKSEDLSDGNIVPGETSPQNEDSTLGQSPSSSDSGSFEVNTNVQRSKSCGAILTTLKKSPSSEFLPGHENATEDEQDNQEKTLIDSEMMAKSGNLSREDSKTSEEQQIVGEEHTDEQQEHATEELNEVIERVLSKEVEDNLQETREPKTEDMAADVSDKTQDTEELSASDWHAEFERQKQTIIELWDACHIPLVHRTYFFLLFKGDPSDSVYMEVELRRLSFLKNKTKDSSAKALNRERGMLSKQMLKKYSTKEREALFEKWGIDLKSKQRRHQLCRRLWANTTDTEHINKSAAIVAKLVGFKEPGEGHKEMFGLSFLPAKSRSFNWR